VTRLVAAEDSYLIRAGLELLLGGQDDLELVAVVASLPELIATVAELGPDVVITDVRMPPTDTDEGIRAAEQLADSHPGLGVVVLSQYVEPDWALRVFDQGSAGRAYLLKERVGDLAQLRSAIDAVRSGGCMLDPQVVDALVRARARRDASPLGRLTPRETEVLALVAAGHSNAGICQDLVLTERAVEKHIGAVFTKLDLDPDDSAVHRRVRAALVYLSSTTD
jgi:DNA-binding NarL/FixJ family response regulator